jgi:hypothetical protein
MGTPTGTTRRPPPKTPTGTLDLGDVPGTLQRLHPDRCKAPAEWLQKWRPEAGDSEDLKEDTKPRAATARASRRPSAQKL